MVPKVVPPDLERFQDSRIKGLKAAASAGYLGQDAGGRTGFTLCIFVPFVFYEMCKYY